MNDGSVFLYPNKTAGTVWVPLTAVVSAACGPRASGAFRIEKLRVAISWWRYADICCARTRHAPLGRKSKPGISQRGYNESWAAALRGVKRRKNATALKNHARPELTRTSDGNQRVAASPQFRILCQGRESCANPHRGS